eukprot:jgi/Botrbrau1/9905/Bobra.0012s0008.1
MRHVIMFSLSCGFLSHVSCCMLNTGRLPGQAGYELRLLILAPCVP